MQVYDANEDDTPDTGIPAGFYITVGVLAAVIVYHIAVYAAVFL